MLARGRVDPRDPQPAEVALAIAPVAVAVLVGLEDGLLGHLVVPAGVSAVALGERQRRAALLTGVNRALDAGHERFSPSMTLMRGTSSLEMTTGRASCRLRLGDFFSRMWLENAWRPRTLPFAVTRKRFLAPEWVFIFGI